MAELKKCPEIRFDSFTRGWKVEILEDNADIGDGLHGTPNYTESGGIYFINGNNLIDGKIFVDNETKKVLQEEQSIADKELNQNTILLSINGTIGNLAFYQGESVMLGKSVAYIKLKVLSKFFIYHYLKSPIIQNHFLANLTGSTIKNLGLKTIRETEIWSPSEEEQIQIGTFFENLDSIIKNHQTQLKKLKNLKKAMLVKMFPQDGASVPEIRFNGFDGQWEETTIKKHSNYRRGSFPQPYGNKEWYDGPNAKPFVQVVDVNKNLSLANDTKQKISELAQPQSVLAKKNTVVVTLQASIGRVAVLQYDAYIDRTILIFEDFNLQTDIIFWAYLIEKVFDMEKIKAPGGTIKTITKESLSNFKLILPEFEEQQKIGNYFDNLDNLIINHNEQLKKLNNIKKACLSKMFVA